MPQKSPHIIIGMTRRGWASARSVCTCVGQPAEPKRRLASLKLFIGWQQPYISCPTPLRLPTAARMGYTRPCVPIKHPWLQSRAARLGSKKSSSGARSSCSMRHCSRPRSHSWSLSGGSLGQPRPVVQLISPLSPQYKSKRRRYPSGEANLRG